MGKLAKLIVTLVVLGGLGVLGWYLVERASESAVSAQQEKAKNEGMQVQEKYGFAPIDDGG